MNNDNNRGQQDPSRDQEHGQQSQQPSGPQSQQSQASSQNAQPIGESDTKTQSHNSSDMGQASDMGQSSQDDGGSGFIGSRADDQNSTYHQSSAGDQSYAEQGRGAPNENDAGSTGISDIETERSQGRESDIEGSSL